MSCRRDEDISSIVEGKYNIPPEQLLSSFKMAKTYAKLTWDQVCVFQSFFSEYNIKEKRSLPLKIAFW